MSDEHAGLASRFDAADQSAGLTLWHVTNRWQAAMRAALAPSGLTHVQYVLLASLVWMHAHDPETPITQTQLAEWASTDVMMTSQVLRALESKGLIERPPHATDRRARRLRPTAAGSDLARRATREVEAADADFFAPLHQPEAWHQDLRRLAR